MSSIPLGIQLYTVRELMSSDFTGTLTALAKKGYKRVEFCDSYGGMSPEELASFLRSIGLQSAGNHTSLERIQDPACEIYAYARALECPYLTVSLAWEVDKDWPATVRQVAAAGASAHAGGCIFTYHNHAQEFERIAGEYALDYLYRNTNPAEVQGELDTFWIKKGGEDPASYLRKYTGRVPQLHIKDMAADGNFTEIGNGTLDWPAIFTAAHEIGVKIFIVEQDSCPGSPLDSAQMSIDNLRKMGLV